MNPFSFATKNVLENRDSVFPLYEKGREGSVSTDAKMRNLCAPREKYSRIMHGCGMQSRQVRQAWEPIVVKELP